VGEVHFVCVGRTLCLAQPFLRLDGRGLLLGLDLPLPLQTTLQVQRTRGAKGLLFSAIRRGGRWDRCGTRE
jgi:hypothetical protein